MASLSKTQAQPRRDAPWDKVSPTHDGSTAFHTFWTIAECVGLCSLLVAVHRPPPPPEDSRRRRLCVAQVSNLPLTRETFAFAGSTGNRGHPRDQNKETGAAAASKGRENCGPHHEARGRRPLDSPLLNRTRIPEAYFDGTAELSYSSGCVFHGPSIQASDAGVERRENSV